MVHPLVSKCRTKIVCTLGPSVETPEKIRALMKAGADLIRINCSHGTPEQRLTYLERVRSCSKELGLFVPVMFDLQGPKIRVGRLTKPIPLNEGDELQIVCGDQVGDRNCIYTTYESFVRDVNPGELIAMDDGKIRLRATDVDEGAVRARVEVGGLLKERKGINLPMTKISAPCLSEKDLSDLKAAIDNKVDMVAVSFVRGAQDMVEVRRQAASMGSHSLHFVSKIERPEALDDLSSLINLSDGVMVARGDLGVEIGAHRVPMIQKEIIARANVAGKFVITATQMLDSMMERPVPTRAEASDVANAILDGTDACMLSGETASGDYPVEAVEMMMSIAQETETHAVYRYQPPQYARGSIHHIPDGISVAAHQTANLMNADLLVAFTNSGSSALRLSKRHPSTPIIGATIHEHTARRMRAYWGVIPILIRKPASVEEMFEEVKAGIVKLDLGREGDVVVLTSGYPMWDSGSTNLMKVMSL